MTRTFCPSIRTRRSGLGASVFFEVFFEMLLHLHVASSVGVSNAGMLRAASQDFGSPVLAFFWGGAMFSSRKGSYLGMYGCGSFLPD